MVWEWGAFRGGLGVWRVFRGGLGVWLVFRGGLGKRCGGKEAAVLFAVTFHGTCFSSKDGC